MENIISVCIITYNQEHYIQRAIESVLTQKTDADIEIIISDDGSTDRTAQICANFQSNYPDQIRFIRSSTNRGVLSNWYQAIQAASSPYIAILEGDDYWIDPEKLSKQLAILEKDQVGFVYTDFYYSDEQNHALVQGMKHYKPSDNLFEETLFDQAITSSTVMFRRKIFDFTLFQRFIENHFLTPDLPLFLQFSFISTGTFLSDVTTVYTWKAGSVSRPILQHDELQFRKSIYRIRLFFIQKARENQKSNLLKNEYIHKRDQLLIAWKHNDFDYACRVAKTFSFVLTWQKDRKFALVTFFSRTKFIFHFLQPYITRKRILQ